MLSVEEIEEKELKELDEHITKYRSLHRLYVRLVAVKEVKMGKTRIEVAENFHVDRKTVGNWVKLYDEGGIENLEYKYQNCGSKCRLTDIQLLDLSRTLTESEKSYDIKGARKLIKDKYGVQYSTKQTWEITRKKLELNYRKPYVIYNEAPDDPNGEECWHKLFSY